MPAETILVAGTASHVGKSTVVAGLCRRLADAGVDVAPFKAQNMSNEARAVVRPGAVRGGDGEAPDSDDSAFGEIGVSQSVQARAAGVRPTTDHNPVLLKPRGEGESQLVVDGVALGHYAAGDYYAEHWEDARDAAAAAHARLAADHDVVVAEGAGSIAEINFHDRDLANVETARFADARILLVADIERGGVFASILGTLELLPEDVRERVAGVAITKFRGDRSLLEPGVDEIESRTGVPVLAVLPYDDPGLPEEDSVSLPAAGEREVRGTDDGVSEDRAVTVAVPRLPRASNTADVDPLLDVPGVRVAFVPPDGALSDADAVVLTGTKNTADDLRAIREAGLHERLREFDGPVVGLCGGYQLLGERLVAADLEAAGGDAEGEIADNATRDVASGDAACDAPEPDAGTTVPGIGLLPVETAFSRRKRVAPVEWTLDGAGPLASATGTVEGYEIHAGETRTVETGESETRTTEVRTAETRTSETGGPEPNPPPVRFPFASDGRDPVTLGAARGDVFGTYLHGLFENDAAREAFLDSVFERAGVSRPVDEADVDGGESDPYRNAADLVEAIPLDALCPETDAVRTDADG
ncbi:cobyric acid synthase [Halobellus limi]|uniref:Probable cobyric acid synthase n=1 Tax=Halobellus limi TaxID=699433 RepID=A0A1H5YID2_9EURY|nr:cobyric acid synthase [Halobellus limi]QCC48438.1 cobyric acid synthase [Halobellus limi]SEG23883.1 adenosylcobyric acid synthase (glutamine-hydrolysing) [Halobellus limi]